MVRLKSKKMVRFSWQTILGCVVFIGITGGWMVTAYTTEDNKKELKDTQKSVQDIQQYITEQRTMNTQQYQINASLVEILRKKK